NRQFGNQHDFDTCSVDEHVLDAPGSVSESTDVAAELPGSTDFPSQQVITAVGGFQQNPCGNNSASLLFVTQQDFGTCAVDEGAVEASGSGAGSTDVEIGYAESTDVDSQHVITAVGWFQQNTCGNNS